MREDNNRVLQVVTWVVALGVLACMLSPDFQPGIYIFPGLLVAAALFIGIYLIKNREQLTRKTRWSIIFSIIAWLIIAAGFVYSLMRAR